jgi:hypothetical protein
MWQLTQAEEADGAVRKAQGDLPTTRQLAGGDGDCENQSDPARWGELLSDRTFEFLFLPGQTLGREEGQAASDACPGTQRLRLEAVE